MNSKNPSLLFFLKNTEVSKGKPTSQIPLFVLQEFPGTLVV